MPFRPTQSTYNFENLLQSTLQGDVRSTVELEHESWLASEYTLAGEATELSTVELTMPLRAALPDASNVAMYSGTNAPSSSFDLQTVVNRSLSRLIASNGSTILPSSCASSRSATASPNIISPFSPYSDFATPETSISQPATPPADVPNQESSMYCEPIRPHCLQAGAGFSGDQSPPMPHSLFALSQPQEGAKRSRTGSVKSAAKRQRKEDDHKLTSGNSNPRRIRKKGPCPLGCGVKELPRLDQDHLDRHYVECVKYTGDRQALRALIGNKKKAREAAKEKKEKKAKEPSSSSGMAQRGSASQELPYPDDPAMPTPDFLPAFSGPLSGHQYLFHGANEFGIARPPMYDPLFTFDMEHYGAGPSQSLSSAETSAYVNSRGYDHAYSPDTYQTAPSITQAPKLPMSMTSYTQASFNFYYPVHHGEEHAVRFPHYTENLDLEGPGSLWSREL